MIDTPTVGPDGVYVPVVADGLSSCPRCGFSVRVTNEHLDDILRFHLGDCPTRPSAEAQRQERREAKREAFFAAKAAERAAANGEPVPAPTPRSRGTGFKCPECPYDGPSAKAVYAHRRRAGHPAPKAEASA